MHENTPKKPPGIKTPRIFAGYVSAYEMGPCTETKHAADSLEGKGLEIERIDSIAYLELTPILSQDQRLHTNLNACGLMSATWIQGDDLILQKIICPLCRHKIL